MKVIKVIKDISYGDEGNPSQKLDIYLPESNVLSTFVYMHGGGLEGGDKADPQVMIQYLVQKGIAVVSINYRFYPEAKYPEYIEDGACAISWVFNNIRNYGALGNIFVGGSSAGGYLSMMLCFDRKYLNKHRINPDDISGYIFDAGQPTVHYNVLRERGIDPRSVIIDEAAPLFYVQENSNTAPMLFLVADNDLENRYEQTMLFVSTLKHFGYPKNKVTLKVMENKTHCQYGDEVDIAGNSVLGKIVFDFIGSIERN